MPEKCLVLVSFILFFGGNVVAQEQKALEDSMMAYYGKSDFLKAIYWGEKNAAAVKQKVGDSDTLYATALHNLGYFYFANGNFSNAKSFFTQAAEILKKVHGEKNADYIFTLNFLGNAYEKLADYAEAEKCFLTGLNLQKEMTGELNDNYVLYINSLAVLYAVTEKFTAAEKLYLQAAEIIKKLSGEENMNYLIAVNNLASFYYRTGKYSLAEKLFLETIRIKKKVLGEDHFQYGNSLSNLGALYFMLGNYKAAEALYTQSLLIFKKQLGQKNPQYLATLGNLGALFLKTNEFAKAEDIFKLQIPAYATTMGKYTPEYATALTNLANLYLKMGKDSGTLQLFEEALEIRKKIKGTTSFEYIQSLQNLASYYTRKDKYNVADSLYKESVSISNQNFGDTNAAFLFILNNQCELYQLMGDYPAAAAVALKGLPNEEIQLRNKLDFLSEIELLAYLKNKEPAFSMPYSSLFRKIDTHLVQAAYNNQLLIKNITIQNTSDLKNQLEQSNDRLLIKLWKDYKTNKSLLNKLLSQPIINRAINTDSLTVLSNQQEKELLRKSAAYRGINNRLNNSWQDVRNNLQSNEAAVEFVRFMYVSKAHEYNFYYAAMLIRPQDTVPFFIKLFEENELKIALNNFAYKAPVQIRSVKNYQAPVIGKNIKNSIYDLVWQPLEPYLANTSTVYFAPDGLLHQLAFAAIPYKNGRLICDRYNLVQLTSTRQVAVKDSSKNTPYSIALFGGINYNHQNSDTAIAVTADPYSYVYQQNRSVGLDSFTYLPNTLKEIEDVKRNMELKQIKVSFYSGDKATEAAFRNLGGASSPEVIHFATHGFTLTDTIKQKNAGTTFKVSDNPLLRSGLVLSGGNIGWKGKNQLNEDDGILTALEISSVSLPNTQLAVLSACETGIGELHGSEGVFGLQRAFKIAGVKYVMASLWQVPDKETGEFMNIFYNNWLNGKTIRKAFINTQKAMHKKYPPYYWAAFTLIQ